MCTATDDNGGTVLNCPDYCTHPTQGTCNILTGICNCKKGYTGDNCAGKIEYNKLNCMGLVMCKPTF